MTRLRAWIALGAALLGASGCMPMDRRVDYRPYRPRRPVTAAEVLPGPEAAGRATPADSTPGGLSRFFPHLPRPSTVAAQLVASRRGEVIARRSVHVVEGRGRSGEVPLQTLPAGLVAEVAPANANAPARREMAAVVAPRRPAPDLASLAQALASTSQPGPRDESALRVQAEEDQPDPEPAPEPESAAADAPPPIAESGKAGTEPEPAEGDGPDRVADAPPPGDEPGAVAPEPVASPDPSEPPRPTPPAVADPALAGRPRMPLVRPHQVPPDLPPPSYPRSYFNAPGAGPRAAAPRSDRPTTHAPADDDQPRARWRPRLLERWRAYREESLAAPAGPPALR